MDPIIWAAIFIGIGIAVFGGIASVMRNIRSEDDPDDDDDDVMLM